MNRTHTLRIAFAPAKTHVGWITLGIFVSAAVVTLGVCQTAAAQEAPAAGDELSIDQAQLADRYARLETVLTRLAELSSSTDPRRARILREAIAKSRQQDLNHRFETIVSLLEEERLSAAANRQTELQTELDDLLSLLLKADRDRELESQHRRVERYLQEVSRLIRLQKGIRARTEGGDEANRLAKDQGQAAEETGKLADSVGESESKDGDSNGQESQSPDQSSDAQEGNKSQQENSQNGSPKGDGGDSESSNGESPQQSQPSRGSESGGQPSPSGDASESSPQQPAEPMDQAAQRLKTAQQRMQKAQQQLDKAERDGAAADQREAIKELELAKSELERVLRQLREEEMERTLTLLAARFRRMLDAQLKIYEETVRIDHVPQAERDHDHEIEAARLSREESLIVREADRALILLREDGTSVAFPETVSLMRDDMQTVSERLANLKVGAITQGLEQDIIEALEESLAALEAALEDLEKKRTPPGQSPQAGEPIDPELVDKLAELRMIRSLQMRVNRRTQRYGKLIEGTQAEAPELLEALDALAERQQRVYQATDDLSQGRND